MGVSTLDNQCAPRLSALLSKTPILCAEIFNKRPSAYSKKNVVRIMITYFNIDGRNLFALAAILNFAVRWCEIWNQEIFGAARISYHKSLHITRQAIGSSESFPTAPIFLGSRSRTIWPTNSKWPPKKTKSTHRWSKQSLSNCFKPIECESPYVLAPVDAY